MANPIKQLAGETAIYGLSTILARIINFALVPLYTRVLTQSDFGVMSEFMAYIAMLQVVLTKGQIPGRSSPTPSSRSSASAPCSWPA